MAGMKGRSGGARLGSGPKPRHRQASWLKGARRALPVPVETAPIQGVLCPQDAPGDVAAVWRELEPYATAERTLEPRTALGFLLLCQNVVLERKLAADPLTCAGSNHRGVLARVEMGLARFRLIPDGKPVAAEAKDEWSEFDRPMTVVQGGKA